MDQFAEYYFENTQAKAEAKTWGWIFTSGLFHAGLAFGILTMTIDVAMPEKPQPIEFEVSQSNPSEAVQSQAPMPEIKQEVAELPAPAAKPLANEVVVKPVPKTLPTKRAVSRPAPQAKRQLMVQTESPVVVKPQDEKLDDSELQDSINKSTLVSSVEPMKDGDVDEDLDKVDRQNQVDLETVKSDLDKETEKVEKEQQEKIAVIEEQQKEEAKNLEALAAQKKQEREAAEKAYVENVLAQQRAAEKAAAEAKQKGSHTEATNFAEVRALEDLRQMPGNKKPQYDSDDRLAQRQGEVAFLAYVSKEGQVTQFKLVKSTGHRSLDLKTLKAVQGWRFYPGQEGWVEIPFKWDLKGGPQEMPATLRRKISRNN